MPIWLPLLLAQLALPPGLYDSSQQRQGHAASGSNP